MAKYFFLVFLHFCRIHFLNLFSSSSFSCVRVCVCSRVCVFQKSIWICIYSRGEFFFHMYTHRRQFSKCICWQEGKENNGRKKKLRGPSLDINQEIACFFFTNFCFLRLFSCNNPLIEISWWTILLVNFGL